MSSEMHITAIDLEKILPQRLDLAMRDRKITNLKLGELIFCSTSSIASYRLGTRRPSDIEIIQICRALDVSADYLLGFTDSSELSRRK